MRTNTVRAAVADATMNKLRCANERLREIEAYDAKNLDVEVFMSANENPWDVPAALKELMLEKVARLPFNRYPDPLSNELRNTIAISYNLNKDNVLVGNGGDELLFDLFLAWGGPNRAVLITPPTFSVYDHNALLTGTKIVQVTRTADFELDEERILTYAREGDIDMIIITSPNNPSGTPAREAFLLELLESTDALVLVDEAYGEFSRHSMTAHVGKYKNLLVLKTFSKAYALAGLRVGYVLGAKAVIDEFIKVRQPYSVNAASQAIATIAFENRSIFNEGIGRIIEERSRLFGILEKMDGVTVYPSDANFLLVRIEEAHAIWQELHERYSVLVRDFSSTKGLEDCLRVTVGSPEQNDRFIESLSLILAEAR